MKYTGIVGVFFCGEQQYEERVSEIVIYTCSHINLSKSDNTVTNTAALLLLYFSLTKRCTPGYITIVGGIFPIVLFMRSSES